MKSRSGGTTGGHRGAAGDVQPEAGRPGDARARSRAAGTPRPTVHLDHLGTTGEPGRADTLNAVVSGVCAKTLRSRASRLPARSVARTWTGRARRRCTRTARPWSSASTVQKRHRPLDDRPRVELGRQAPRAGAGLGDHRVEPRLNASTSAAAGPGHPAGRRSASSRSAVSGVAAGV